MIGIIGAMEVEVEVILEHMECPVKKTKAGMDFYQGTIHGKEYVLVKCGIGKVNAGICVQILVDLYHVDAVINQGIAGSLCNDLDIGDMVVSTAAIQHDVNLTNFGYERGQLAGTKHREIYSDENLSTRVYEFLKQDHEFKTVKGLILSGDQFIADDQVKKDLTQEYHGICVEMEGAAIAQAANSNGIPFVIIRAVSDKADGSSTVDYPVFEKKIANIMGHTMVRMIENNII